MTQTIAIILAACAVVGIALLAVYLIFRKSVRRLEYLVEDRAVERFRDLVKSFDEADRAAMAAALEVRHMTEQELKLVARSAECVLWHAEVQDLGEEQLKWDLRIFAEELGEFVNIHRIPANYRVGAWYHGRKEEEMFRLADSATQAIRGGEAGYQQEFECRAKDGGPVWFKEDVRIEKVGRNTWHLFGVSTDITERKHHEEQREKLLKELQEALAHVKQLRGMLPICSSCKKIRDDDGYWNQIDQYIKTHTDVEFSHSFCPDCLKKLYPDYTDGDGGINVGEG